MTKRLIRLLFNGRPFFVDPDLITGIHWSRDNPSKTVIYLTSRPESPWYCDQTPEEVAALVTRHEAFEGTPE